MLLNPRGKQTNWWMQQEVPMIPLGIQTNQGEVVLKENGKPRIVMARYPEYVLEGRHKGISNTLLACGKTGVGKSVGIKSYEFFCSFKRPIIDWDWTGEDSNLCHEPNSQPTNLAPYTAPGGIKGDYLYYPVMSSRTNNMAKRPKKPYEKTVRPDIGKYDETQLQALKFSPGAAMYFENILDKYGPFENWESLIEFIESFPTPQDVSRIAAKIKKGKLKLRHKKMYEPGDTMNSQSKESIKKVLPDIISKGVFALDDRQEYDFVKAFTGYTKKELMEFKQKNIEPTWKPTNMFFSFLDKDVARVEIHYLMKEIELLRRWFPGSPRYLVKIEECHQIFDQEGKKVEEVIENFVFVCRKLSILLLLVMPTISREVLTDAVLGDIKEFICGQLSPDDARRIARHCGSYELASVLMNLEFNRYKNEREFCYYSSDLKRWWTFKPYNSPCEIHRE